MGPTANSDGLIKCLPPTQDNFVTSPNIYARKLCSIYKILWHPDSCVSRDSIFGLAGLRASALFFARTETISSWHETTRSLNRTWYHLTVSPWPLASRPSTGTGKKQVTSTLRYRSGQAPTAPNYCSAALTISRAVSIHTKAVLGDNLLILI